MILYQIFDENSCTWFQDVRFHGWIWGDRKKATTWLTVNGPSTSMAAIRDRNDRGVENQFVIQRRPVIRPYDIWAARQVLLDLNAAQNLGDVVRDIQRRENTRV